MQNEKSSKVLKCCAAAILAVATSLAVSSSAASARTEVLPLSLCAPASNTFSIVVDNPFFPLPAGQQWVFVGKEGADQLGLQITVLSGVERFYKASNDGVPTIDTRRVEETEWEDEDADGVIDPGEFVIETSINYYAQTQDGTVCYFGEDVSIFHPDGTVTSEGAWRADAPGNAPGIFMPAEPQDGMTFQQEVASGVAEDTASIVAVGRTVKTPAGAFTDTIRTRDFNPLDGSKGTKSYASGVGLVHDGPLLLLSY
ncbi:MAG TPA: hypothetical protein VES67_16925 [Vicinamibacterales bacterium]|nr:hypothetical protein [Vicinamibacterales bacterium]